MLVSELLSDLVSRRVRDTVTYRDDTRLLVQFAHHLPLCVSLSLTHSFSLIASRSFLLSLFLSFFLYLSLSHSFFLSFFLISLSLSLSLLFLLWCSDTFTSRYQIILLRIYRFLSLLSDGC